VRSRVADSRGLVVEWRVGERTTERCDRRERRIDDAGRQVVDRCRADCFRQV
jgi:hypothetical protein